MDENEVRQLYRAAWKQWGAAAQVDMIIEEMAELTQAFLHARRNGKVFNHAVYEEIADVSICLDQMMKKIEEIGNEDELLNVVDNKLERLRGRLIKDANKIKDITLGTPGANR